jgi:hypothetical protein
MVFWGVPEVAKYLQIDVLLRCCFSQMFRRFTRVAAPAASAEATVARASRLATRNRRITVCGTSSALGTRTWVRTE